jgi:type IV secretory pathway VirJ component
VTGRLIVAGLALSTRVATAQVPAAPAHLPVIEAPVPDTGRTLTLLITGDGGWAALVKGVTRALGENGMPVVALDARRYLSSPKTPEQTAADVARLLRWYLRAWHRDSVVLLGYSRGADLVPFVANRLPADLASRVRLVAMFAPSTTASFEFHLIDLLEDVQRPTDVPIRPEIERLSGTPLLCVYGEEEKRSLCPTLPPARAQVVARPGGHHFGGDRAALARLILTALGDTSSRS